ncbi:GNAT family N-acetyltransferase [Streptomyces broussonetiae]|uniref:GNAT family N-acetyltransferase n=1 Tax=Streptomyces broussonetiae TaxID=2686304 RepID=A0ABV5EE04_9ACTN
MRPDGWHLTDDVDDFLAQAGDFLRSQPAPHVMQLTWTERLRTRGAAAYGPQAPVLGLLKEGGRVLATFLRTPPRLGLGLSPLTPGQADALAAHLAALGTTLPSVGADEDTAAAFAGAWRRHTGATAALRVRLHLYRLGTLTPPEPFPAGRGRAVGEGDLKQLMAFCRGFAADVGEDVTIDAGSWADTRFADKRYTFWETPDGTPVSLAGANPMISGMVQIDPVYTPAHLRGHGYAGAATVAAVRAVLAEGATDVVLFTDAANPTSNALYQRLGFVRIADWAAYEFAPPAP